MKLRSRLPNGLQSKHVEGMLDMLQISRCKHNMSIFSEIDTYIYMYNTYVYIYVLKYIFNRVYIISNNDIIYGQMLC